MTRRADTFRRIKINVRRTFSGSGDMVADSLVRCPGEDEMVSMDRCATCGQCDGLIFDGSPDHSFIICRRMPTHLEPTPNGPVSLRRAARADETLISDVMNRNVLCVGPDLSLAALGELLVARGFSGAPVVDQAGRPIGIISKSDLIRDRIEGGAKHHAKTVGEAMMPVVFTLLESATVAEASAVMAHERIHRLPVISRDGVVVGIVSTLDVLGWLAQQHEYELPTITKS